MHPRYLYGSIKANGPISAESRLFDFGYLDCTRMAHNYDVRFIRDLFGSGFVNPAEFLALQLSAVSQTDKLDRKTLRRLRTSYHHVICHFSVMLLVITGVWFKNLLT